MSINLFPHTISSTITLRDAVLLMVGQDPNRCFATDFEPNYGPFVPITDNEQERQELYSAYEYLKVLKEELTKPDGCLVIDRLVVHVKTVKVRSSRIDIPDLITLARVIQEKQDRIEHEVLTSGAFEVLPFSDKPCISIMNPSSFTMREVYQGHWTIQSSTAVSMDSIREWAISKGIDCQFARLGVGKAQKVQRAEDATNLIDLLISCNCPYISEKLKATLLAVRHNCEYGHDTLTFKQSAELFVRKNYSHLPAENIGSIVNTNVGKGRAKKGFLSLSDYLGNKK
ncbi:MULTISPECIES: hypothetical protein [unclassified Endozoicomonas]|uniref:hypothetical protein n=1 Tax=unclassified Endozoicomonas TaxID=2644528 RepID=UPI002148D579|nr:MULTISPECIES: hypothetical protein [unclassified Endozoicomonas]